jgi:hypothetical protein
MAKYENGPMGPFRGKLGNIVGTSWKGIPVMRTKPIKGKRPRRAKGNEKQNQSKFAMAHYWLQPLLKIVREGFKGYKERLEGFNAAKSYLLNNAFEGEKPDIHINPALVRLSFGDLPLPSGITAGLAAEQLRPNTPTIEFSWDPKSITPGADNWDQVMVAAYDVQGKEALVKIHGQFRSAGSHIIDVRADHTYHLYLAFTSKDRSRQSDSVYLGEISV